MKVRALVPLVALRVCGTRGLRDHDLRLAGRSANHQSRPGSKLAACCPGIRSGDTATLHAVRSRVLRKGRNRSGLATDAH